MNRFFCFLTGGHKYKDSTLEVRFDDDNGTVTFANHCDKCGKPTETTLPQSSIIIDMQKALEKFAEAAKDCGSTLEDWRESQDEVQ